MNRIEWKYLVDEDRYDEIGELFFMNPAVSQLKAIIIFWEPPICTIPHLMSVICYYVCAVIHGMQRK